MLRRILIVTMAVVIVLAIGQEAEANWLNGWDNRIKLTIDHNDITSNLSNFPILIHLSNSSGRKNDDVSCVFDELTSDANRKKIAVTKSNGTTQCYVEIEKWDDANEQAWLWVRVSGTGSISRSVDTDLYLYYDKDQTDNTSYVGDSGSTIAQNVWDSSSKMVQHLDETDIDGGSGDIKDSTSNGNNGTTKNMNPSDQVPGQIDGSFDFDGNNDYIDLRDIPFPSGNSPRSVSFWINDVASELNHYIFFYGRSTINNRFSICIDNRRGKKLSVIAYGVDNDWAPYVLPTGVWKHVAFTFDGSTIKLYIDGSFEKSTTRTYNTILVEKAYIGVHEDMLAFFEGMLDELRISNTARSAAWIKASYESGKDHLLDFGSEEEAPKNAIFFGINF